MRVEGRLLQFAVSDNVGAHGPDGPGSPPIWAVNVHGVLRRRGDVLEGRAPVWPNSSAGAWSTPACPGSAAVIRWTGTDVSMEMLANQIMAVLHQVDAGPVVGARAIPWAGAVAVQFAHDHPRHTLGLIYRDGVSTPAWKLRHGVVSTVVAPFAPNVAPLVDLAAAAS